MKRKLLSFAIAFALLAQTVVSAGALTTWLGTAATLPIVPNSGAVPTIVTGGVMGAGESVYSASTTQQNFDYKASIDMSNVRSKFDAFYALGDDMTTATYTTDYANSLVTGSFDVTFAFTSGITQLPTAATFLSALALPSTSIFKIVNIDTTTPDIVVVTADVRDPDTGLADLTVAKLNTNKATYLADFDLSIDSLSANVKNSTITVSMVGYVNIGEADEPSNPYARIDFSSNSSPAMVYVGSSGGGGAAGGGTVTPTPTPTPSDGDITIGESGNIETDNQGGKTNTTTKKDSDGTTTTTTTTTNTTTEKGKDGSTTTTTTTQEVVSEKPSDKDTVSKVTVTETTQTTEKAKDGTTTTTTTVKETTKETDEDTGVTNISITETTEAPAEEGAEEGSKTSQQTSSRTIILREKPEEKPGFVENGWSSVPYAPSDKNYTGTSEYELPITQVIVETTTVVVDEDGNPVLDADGNEQLVTTTTVTSSVAFYPRYVNVTVPEALEQEKDENGNPLHKVYIAGYPDGEVKPNNNITREEVTAAFDRLLNLAFREKIATTEQDFPDVEGERWSNDSIATMANGGFIVGDENGNFNPSKPITRAEFAVIAAKFAPEDAALAENYFTDIDGHWAKDFILKIAGQYWISGNPDGTFNPDAPITRAEAMTIINRMLVRYGDGDADNVTEWPDVDKADWFYEQVIEATTNNVYERTENGWSEKWVSEEEK